MDAIKQEKNSLKFLLILAYYKTSIDEIIENLRLFAIVNIVIIYEIR